MIDRETLILFNIGNSYVWGLYRLKYEIKYKPSYSILNVGLENGEQITGEDGALIYMTPNIEVETHMR